MSFEIKGTAIIGQVEYVKAHHGDAGMEKWMEALSEPARKIIENKVLASSWYDGTLAMEMRQKICDLFFNGRVEGAREIGRHSAQVNLKGIYKFAIKLGSPNWVLDKARSVMSQFFRPGNIETISNEKGNALIRMSEFPDSSGLMEQSIIGFIEVALELSGAKNFSVDIEKSLAKGDSATEFRLQWKA